MKIQLINYFIIITFTFVVSLMFSHTNEKVFAQESIEGTMGTESGPQQLILNLIEKERQLQNDFQNSFNQTLKVFTNQLNFDSINASLTSGIQYVKKGEITLSITKMQEANDKWMKSSKDILNVGDELSKISKNNSLELSNHTKFILNYLGEEFIKLGKSSEGYLKGVTS